MEHFCSEEIEAKRHEIARKLIHLASDYGKKMVSPQTGYFHYYGLGTDVHHTIPFLENLHLALVWMRMHTLEHVQAGKTLLENLLNFRVGNQFPIFLHEYPHCKDEFLPHKVLLPLAYIYKEYSHVLGQELRSKVEKILEELEIHCTKNPCVSKLITYKVACARKLLGLSQDVPVFDGCYALPEMNAEAALAAYLVQDSLYGQPLWKELTQGWHSNTLAFAGPVKMGRQNRFCPEITGYELLMWYLQGELPHRNDVSGAHALLLAGFLPDKCKDPLPENGHQKLAVTFLDKQQRLQTNEDHKFHPLYVLWGESSQPSTFACQVEPQVFVKTSQGKDSLEMLFTFDEEFSGNDDDKAKEINFYFNSQTGYSPEMSINGEKASTFVASQAFSLIKDSANIKLSFETMAGEGNFVAHILSGNRPSQMANHGAERFSAFDWQLLIRTISRSKDAQLKVRLELSST